MSETRILQPDLIISPDERALNNAWGWLDVLNGYITIDMPWIEEHLTEAKQKDDHYGIYQWGEMKKAISVEIERIHKEEIGDVFTPTFNPNTVQPDSISAETLNTDVLIPKMPPTRLNKPISPAAMFPHVPNERDGEP